jgi:hypothetical protein
MDSVDPPPGGPHDLGRMEARIARLEEAVPRIERRLEETVQRLDGLDSRLRVVEQGVSGISAKLDLLTDKVVSKLPSWWQMPAVIGSTVALLVALYGAVQFLRAKGLF